MFTDIVSDRILLRSRIAKRYGPSVNSFRPSPSMPSYLPVYIYQMFARRHLESRIESKIAPIDVYITMRALQKPESDTPRTTSKSEPPNHRFVAEIETITEHFICNKTPAQAFTLA
jgi:hypothetical protein